MTETAPFPPNWDGAVSVGPWETSRVRSKCTGCKSPVLPGDRVRPDLTEADGWTYWLCGNCGTIATTTRRDMSGETPTGDVKPVRGAKPRGKCGGCAFEYQLGTARTGDHKGEQVIRKHNSRTGPGLCEGAQQPPLHAQEVTCDHPYPGQEDPPLFCALPADHGGDHRDGITTGVPVSWPRDEDLTTVPPSPQREHCQPRACMGCCGCSRECTEVPCTGARTITIHPSAFPVMPPVSISEVHAENPPRQPDPWSAPAPASDIPEKTVTVSGQPEPDPFTAPLPYAVSGDRTNASDGGDSGVQPPQVHPGNGVSGVDGGTGPGWLRTDQREEQVGAGAPTDVPPLGGGDPRGAHNRSPVQEHDLRGSGPSGSGDAVGEHATATGIVGAPQRQEDALPQGAPVRRGEHPVRLQEGGAGVPTLPRGSSTGVPAPVEDPFVSPGPVSDTPTATTVSGQPEPDRDSYGRYLLPLEGKRQPATRATTFAKLGANTKAIGLWNERNVIRGLTLRPDLLMLANGLEVKRDRNDLNSIAAQARDAAGSKVAANIGTAYHAFSERLDAGLITLTDVPEQYRRRVEQYLFTTQSARLTTRPEWIERTTAVRADQIGAPLPVAGTLDRIFQLPDGSLVIGDLKTGSDLSYGEMEIEVQLALYAHGVNTHGLFDWNTKTWEDGDTSQVDEVRLRVRTDIAIVVHLPADRDGCTLYVADIERGWRDAQRLGPLQSSLKEKKRFRTLMASDLAPVAAQPSPEPITAAWLHAMSLFRAATDQQQLARLYQYALDSGKFHQDQLAVLVGLGRDRLNQLAKQA